MGINEQMVTELIRHQQEGLSESDNAYWIGEQLLDMVRGDEHAAGILAEDLANNKDMSLAAAERKIEAYARQHKKGHCGCCPPPVAERLLREFYGLGEKKILRCAQDDREKGAQDDRGRTEPKLIELEDFF